MRRSILAVSIAALAHIPAVAEQNATAEWKCSQSAAQLDAFQVIVGNVTVNNITLDERNFKVGMDFSDKRETPNILLKYSVANRSDKVVETSVELVAFDGDKLLFALNGLVFNSLNGIPSHGTADGQGQVHSAAGELRRATSFCVRVNVAQ
jgi:hypothetical protein